MIVVCISLVLRLRAVIAGWVKDLSGLCTCGVGRFGDAGVLGGEGCGVWVRVLRGMYVGCHIG